MVRTHLFFFGALSLIFVGMTAMLLYLQLPENGTLFSLFLPSESLSILLIQSYTLPRIAMALLAGGALSFASLLLQQVMNNPLASDNTLGISSGAQFALFLATIFLPTVFPNWQQGSSVIALMGAGLSLLLVMGLAMRKTMSPLLLILAGLVVNLYFGAFTAMMMLFYPEESRGLALWGAGSLVQESWRDSQWLAVQSALAFALIALFIRPLSMLSLNESNAQSLGLPVGKLRLLGVLVSAFLIACVVSVVGMVGFVGLSAATIVRQLGVRTLKGQLFGTFFGGALLLAITDVALQLLNHFTQINLPTGAVTALIGTPLLLWLMFRALPHSGRLESPMLQKPNRFSPLVVWLLVGSFILIALISLCLGKEANGWYWLEWNAHAYPFFELRLPRMMVAVAVGILIAVAGVLLQRLTLNPMASPELLGVSSGASMGVLVVLLCFTSQATSLFWLAGVAGALLTLVLISAINQRNGMLPEKVLLTGISLSAMFDTLQRIVIASGSPRAMQLIAWTSGSTQQTENHFALPLLIASLLLLALSLIFSRWLALLALQAPMAQALGMNVPKARFALILFSALLTALATLIIGPLSFIGLLVPHLTRLLGVHKAHAQLLISALIGATIMLAADWLGRQILFPYEVPAGLVATFLGGSYFLAMIRRV